MKSIKLSNLFSNFTKKLKKYDRILLPNKSGIPNFKVRKDQLVSVKCTRVPEEDCPNRWFVMIGDSESILALEQLWQTAVHERAMEKIGRSGGLIPKEEELKN